MNERKTKQDMAKYLVEKKDFLDLMKKLSDAIAIYNSSIAFSKSLRLDEKARHVLIDRIAGIKVAVFKIEAKLNINSEVNAATWTRLLAEERELHDIKGF